METTVVLFESATTMHNILEPTAGYENEFCDILGCENELVSQWAMKLQQEVDLANDREKSPIFQMLESVKVEMQLAKESLSQLEATLSTAEFGVSEPHQDPE